jgi:hypothetical protein
LSKNSRVRSPNTREPKLIKVILAFFSVSFLLFGSNVVMMSYAQPQGLPSQGGGLAPQLQQQQQQQPPSSNATTQLQQQAPPITFQQEEEPCDGAYFVGPGGVTKCM